jgi:hypothetical protein
LIDKWQQINNSRDFLNRLISVLHLINQNQRQVRILIQKQIFVRGFQSKEVKGGHKKYKYTSEEQLDRRLY